MKRLHVVLFLHWWHKIQPGLGVGASGACAGGDGVITDGGASVAAETLIVQVTVQVGVLLALKAVSPEAVLVTVLWRLKEEIRSAVTNL
jgi:Ni,Fe-hydrogenase III small subunit